MAEAAIKVALIALILHQIIAWQTTVHLHQSEKHKIRHVINFSFVALRLKHTCNSYQKETKEDKILI